MSSGKRKRGSDVPQKEDDSDIPQKEDDSDIPQKHDVDGLEDFFKSFEKPRLDVPKKDEDMLKNLVCYGQDDEFYMCRKCRTHLALFEERHIKFGVHAFFKNLVNVDLGEQYVIGEEGTGTGVTVYCIKCDSYLGEKYVTMAIWSQAIRPGRSILDLDKLLLLRKGEVFYADTEKPLEDDQDLK